MSSASPIFVVGVPRSGTTLLATLLSSHSRISCGAETHFFPYLEANYQKALSILKPSRWTDEAARFMTSLTVEDYHVHELFGVTPEAICRYLRTRSPSIQALLESLTVQQMRATQKGRWLEKTPNHILHLKTIRNLYPSAAIVRIVRDPRDSAYSIAANLPWASNSPLENAYLISEWHRKSQPFFARDHLNYTLRYEDLVAQPKETLGTLCAFIQEPFEPTMLTTEAAAKYTVHEHEPWKKKVAQEISQDRCYTWKKQKRDRQVEAVSVVCQDMISQFDYDALKTSVTPIFSHYTSYQFVKSYSSEIETLLDEGSLLVPCNPLDLPSGETVLYCDVPISGTRYAKSMRKFIDFLSTLAALHFKGVTVTVGDFCRDASSERNVLGKIASAILVALGSEADLDANR
jgi:hypothetical protein